MPRVRGVVAEHRACRLQPRKPRGEPRVPDPPRTTKFGSAPMLIRIRALRETKSAASLGAYPSDTPGHPLFPPDLLSDREVWPRLELATTFATASRVGDPPPPREDQKGDLGAVYPHDNTKTTELSPHNNAQNVNTQEWSNPLTSPLQTCNLLTLSNHERAPNSAIHKLWPPPLICVLCLNGWGGLR